MPYRNLLVHVDDSRSCKARLEVAIDLAKVHGAHLTGLYVAIEPLLSSNIRAEVPAEFLAAAQEHARARAVEAKARFEETVKRAGLPADCRTEHCASTRVPEVIALHARYSDLAILGQPSPDDGEIDVESTEDVVLSSGRAGLIVPFIGAQRTPGRRVMVAWDGGREAARAVADAMPILERAESVTVLVINASNGNHGERPGADIALHLARHDIKVDAQQLGAKGLSVADALLSRLADEAIDLLVMGAYGHSRLREWVLGGTTRQIFREMTVPVLMSH